MDGATVLHVPLSADASGEYNDRLTLVDYGERVIALLTDNAGQVVGKNVALAGKLNLGRLAGGATLAGVTRIADADDFIFAAGDTSSLARNGDYGSFLLSSTGPVQISRGASGTCYYKSHGIHLPGEGFAIIPLQQLLLQSAMATPRSWQVWEMGERLHIAFWQDENSFLCRSFNSPAEADSLYYMAIIKGTAPETGMEVVITTIESSRCQGYTAALQLWHDVQRNEQDAAWLLTHL